MNRLFSLFLLLLLNSGCSQLPEKTGQPDSTLWLAHQLALEAIQSWDIKGRIAIKKDKENGTLTLYWQQQDPNYQLRFIAPFGQGTYLFKGSDSGVSMSGPKGMYLTAATAEQLIYQHLGWDIELDSLRYWIRGLPQPGLSPTQLLLDEQGRLSSMQQSGFDVNVSRYTELQGISLPQKLSIKNDRIQLKIIIQSWEIH